MNQEKSPARPRTLIIGLGNPILCDDAVGIRVAQRLRALLDARRIEVIEACVGGFRLLEVLTDRERVILIDALQLGGEPGQIYRLSPDQFRGSVRAASPHDAGLPEALRLGRKLGYPMPGEILIFGIEAAKVTDFGETLTPQVAAAVPEVVTMVLQEVEAKLCAAIQARQREDRLSCAAAFDIAREHKAAPLRVAALAEALGFRIGWCQLGLFAGARKQDPEPAAEYPEVPPTLRRQLEKALQQERLPCAQAWAVARRLGLERIRVGQAADALGIRISSCQLGCFE